MNRCLKINIYQGDERDIVNKGKILLEARETGFEVQ